MEDKIFDVTNAIVREDEVVMALMDSRYNSIMVVKPTINEEGQPVFAIFEPDGAEWLYWQEKFGMISEEDFENSVAKLKPKNERKKLFDKLKGEFDEPLKAPEVKIER